MRVREGLRDIMCACVCEGLGDITCACVCVRAWVTSRVREGLRDITLHPAALHTAIPRGRPGAPPPGSICLGFLGRGRPVP